MLWKIFNPVLETRSGDVWEHQLSRIRKRNRDGLLRESEGFIVPFEDMGQHNPVLGKEPCFVHATKERRVLEIAVRLLTPLCHQDATEEALWQDQVK